MRRKKSKLFLHFREEVLLLDGFLRDIDSPNHAINPVRLEQKSDLLPLPSRCTKSDRQTDRQTDKGPWNLQEITSPFGENHLMFVMLMRREYDDAVKFCISSMNGKAIVVGTALAK